jgi:hypothetical protein
VDQFGVSENLFPGNFTNKEQDVVMLPKNLKTAPDAEETKLAYITPDEQALLAFMKPGTPHVGPEDVPSYDSIDYDASGNPYYTSSEQATQMEQGASASDVGMSQAHQDAYEGSALEPGQAWVFKDGEHTGEVFQGNIGTPAEETTTETTDNNMLNTALNVLGVGSGVLPMMKFTQGLDKAAQAWEEKQVEDLISKLGTGEAATGWGNLLAAMTTDGKLNKRGKDWFEDWGDKLGEGEHKETKWDDKDPEKQLEELLRLAKGSGGDEFMKHYDPAEYYKDPKNWDAKEMAKAQREGKLGTKDNPSGFTRDNTRIIEEGRRLLEQETGPAQDRHPGTGAPIEKIIEEDEVVTTTTDPRAGAFNVGGTMPYTEDIRTAGVETDVPLGRRFDIDKAGKYRGTTGGMDLNEAMQYATLGGYGQLEPFQEYLARRRKHLGEEEPQYFDEEGNVIYSEVT